MIDQRSKRVGDLRRGDRVRLAEGGDAIITHAKPDDGGRAMPHRASAPRVAVPAFYVIWKPPGAREQGQLVDPDDRVLLA